MIIALAGQKGGSGKSTVAVAIAAEWHARGLRVLLVDADPQGTVRTWGAVAAEQGHAAPVVVSVASGFHRPDQLPTLAAAYDHVVIDCPPRLGELQRSALAVAHVAVLPTGPAASDVWALTESLELVRRAQDIRPELRAVVLINRKVPRTTMGAAARQALEACGLPVLGTELVQRVAFPEAVAAGLGPTTYEPKSEAAREVRRLVKELEGYGKSKA